MDTVDFGDVYAFTGVDIFSKEADVFLAPRLTAFYGYSFLKQAMQRRFHGFSETIQTDGGHEFKSEFKKHVLEYSPDFILLVRGLFFPEALPLDLQ